MARYIGMDDDVVYRAVIALTYGDGRTRTEIYGPYSKPGPAKAQITSAVRKAAESLGYYRDPAYSFTATGRVESAKLNWT